MNILLFTTSLLIMLSILTYSRLNSFLDSQICHKIFLSHSLSQKECQNLHESEFYTMRVLSTEPRRPKTSKPYTPPDIEKAKEKELSTSKQRSARLLTLQARLPFSFDEQNINDPHALTFYEVAARLIRQLYGDQPFFNALPKAEYRILDALRQAYHTQKEAKHGFQGTPALSEHLGSFILEEAALQKIWHLMLKGNNDPKKGYPSLLDYMTVNSGNEKINLPFARKEVLQALFEKPELVESLTADRGHLLKVYIGQDKDDEVHQTKAEVQNALKKVVHGLVLKSGLEEAAYDKLLDYELKYNPKFHTQKVDARRLPQIK